MHTLTLQGSVELGPQDRIDAGQYLVEDVAGAQLVVMAGSGQMAPFVAAPERAKLDPARDYNGQKILLVRAGGFGDLVLLTPVLSPRAKYQFRPCW